MHCEVAVARLCGSCVFRLDRNILYSVRALVIIPCYNLLLQYMACNNCVILGSLIWHRGRGRIKHIVWTWLGIKPS